MLGRRKSFHKSTPALLDTDRRTVVHNHYGRDELAESYLDLRDQHHNLRKEANKAKDEIRVLQVKLQRLIEEKKRHFRLHRTEREISLEEIVYDLEHRMEQQNRQNAILKQKLHLLQIDSQQSTVRHQQNNKSRRVSSATTNVQSRIDSGIRASINGRPLSSINRKQVSFAGTGPEMNEAKNLLTEAKNEIIRLECLAEEQQELLESLLEQSNKFSPEYRNTGQSTYQLTTTTTTLSSSLSSSSLFGDHHRHHPELVEPEHQHTASSTDTTTYHQNSGLEELLTQYRTIMLQSEASSRIGAEVRALIESLHNALQNERNAVIQLRKQLHTVTVNASELAEKDQQISVLRKENAILQDSIQDCMEKCMSLVETPETGVGGGHRKSSENDHKTLTELNELRYRLAECETQYETQKTEYSLLIGKHRKLQQLCDNDQLHVKHLEAKIERLTRLVFAQELDSETDATEQDTISGQLDQLLNSIVKKSN